MKQGRTETRVCSICGKSVPRKGGVAGVLLRESIRNVIRQEAPGWTTDGFVCREDLDRFRSRHVHDLLESEKGELTALERQVVQSLREHEVLAANVDRQFEQKWTFGERMADRIASFGGSWRFLIAFGTFLLLWILMNSVVLTVRPVDPYPFILLNLMLSCLAAIQAPIIMMSQNRQEMKDRVRSQHDYQVNLKAELEIRNLHEKVDHLLSHQWDRLVEIQEVQLELLTELGKGGK